MIRKLTLAAGFGAGYVLGAKAGTERYNQIMAKFRELSGRPAVQDVKNNLSDTAGSIGDTAKAKVNETISAAGDKVTEVADLSAAKPKSKTGPRTPAAPMPGAAPSITAPDA